LDADSQLAGVWAAKLRGARLLGVMLRAGRPGLADPPPPWLPPIAGWKEAKLRIAKALAGVSAGATLSAIARKLDVRNMAISCG
jgi:hypothetical protein